MKTLVSPSSRVVVDKYWDREKNAFVQRLEACFLRPKRSVDFRFLNLVCFLQQSKPVKPVICLSSKTQTELEVTDDQIQETHHTKTIHVKFQLQKECSFGQQFLIVGDDPMFGLWDPSSAIPMNWSDGNVWTVELDIPVGKSVQFKFILKEITGNILWQPGPDRIFQTWETKNTITVCEDWADAELQKIMEENQANQSVGSNVNSDMSIVAENLTLPEELALNITKEPTFADSSTDPAEKPLAEPWKEQIVADKVSPSQEEPKTTVAENITPKWPKSYMEPCEEQIAARTKVVDEERVIFPSEDYAAISNKELLVADNIFGNNGRAATVRNLSSTHIEGSLINSEEGHVLVPGLTPSPAIPTEEAKKEKVEKQMSFDDGSVGAFEAKDLKMPEIQLDLKQEPNSDPPQAETTAIIKDNVQSFDNELEQSPAKNAEHSNSESANGSVLHNDPPQEETNAMINNKEEKSDDDQLNQMHHPAKWAGQSDSEPINNNVLDNDVQWGRKMLQKFLNNFRLL
ncbi:uncharacterized protein Pyn_35706 [Prunus yedoensis var. nudiflora]|uniref:CBM20 domain-containing protein n=1 Tax=Prunus yedoensis var. nudiflora TaxID=2094558 RepID=A0A314UKE1_PRUYE|nr:uncharacterized protein Pyn_35706 [Prunus yedoensis var. nudiflora]